MRYKEEEGQAVVLLALAMGIFLILGVGLAVDGSHIYAQRQMAQNAADGAAQAGIMSIFDGTNSVVGNTAGFSTGSSFTCSTTDARTPCAYAIDNGFGGSASDTVTVDFPTSAPGVTLSATDPVNLLRVTVQRSVGTTLMRLLGPAATTVTATATAAIVNVVSPVPIIVTHPTLTQSLSVQGTPSIKICGGPNRSIQVNSGSSTAFSMGGNASVDLSHAGPADTHGDCSLGTGADFGTFGGPATNPGVLLGTTGHYIEPSSPIQDPLANVNPPAVPTNGGAMGTSTSLNPGVSGCPASPRKGCQLYNPGLYPTGINGDNSTPVFKPGIYYLQGGGLNCTNNCDMYMATGFTDSGANTTGTGWTGNVLFYNTGTVTTTVTGKKTTTTSTYAPINLGANGTISLVGSPSNSSYLGMLFFEDRSAPALSHTLGGGGAMTLVGTIYLTNPLATMADPTHYQALSLQGGSGSGTLIQGEIIVGTLALGGNGAITMDLNPNATLVIRQVALVN
jgi:Putative Flp pilus-assembly TadE/G-like